MLIGVPMGYFIARVKLPFKGLILSLGILPIILPSFVGAFSWIILLGRQGVIRQILNPLLGFIGITIPPITGMFGMIFVMTMTYYPFVFLMCYGAFEAANPLLEEASWISHANWLYTFRRVSLPLILPAVITGMILTFTTLLQELSTTILLYSAKTRTVPIQIYGAVADGKFGEASALSVLLIVTVFVIVYAVNKWRGRSFISSFTMG